MKIAIAGATGFIGTRLVAQLINQGEQVLILTRNRDHAKRVFPTPNYPHLEIIPYNPTQSGDWQKSLSGCDAVINLAGEPVGERWTKEHKQAILESRQLGTQKIVEAIALSSPKPKVLINASAIGYYGTSETATFDETSNPGDDFLAQVCQAWEAEAKKVTELGVRLVIFRTGIVLGMGGALAKMLTPFKLYAGGPLGDGHQWFSWIHRDDLINLIIYALKSPEMAGTFNATAPNPIHMNELCQTLAKILHRPSWLPVPSFALELLLGEGAKLVLEGQQVLPKKTQSIGFKYQYPTINSALEEILS